MWNDYEKESNEKMKIADFKNEIELEFTVCSEKKI
jgi:hypothetical protein